MKEQIKPTQIPVANSEKISKISLFQSNDFFPAILLLLYMVVEIIPNLGAYDVSGPQWLYLNSINAICIVYILCDKKSGYIYAIRSVTASALTIIYLLFVLLAGLSVIVAANKVESLCCYTMLLTTVLMYLNIAILLYRRMHLFPLIAQAISILLFIQALQILYKFYEGMQLNKTLDEVLETIQLNAGHKNILAASMVIKFPFLIYTIYKGNLKVRLFTMSIFAFAVCGLILLNARSTFLALLFIICIYVVFFIREYLKIRSAKMFVNLVGIVVLFIIGILLSNVLFSHSKIYSSDFYGTFLQKMSSIKLSNEGSDNRFWLWGNALSYIKNNLLFGCGYGNWKLTAIPYERNTLNELIVSLHVHNDFLETTAETGIIGGLLFVSIFIVLAWFIFKTYLQKRHFQLKEIAPVLLAILACYFVDANLNFPKGRPIMQFYFAFLLALCYNFYHDGGLSPFSLKKVSISQRMFGSVYMVVLIPAIIIQVFIYNSLVAQEQFSMDSLQQPPSMNWDDVKDVFPVIPNMDIQCLPIGEIKAKYLIKENRNDEALNLLLDCSHVNPDLGYNDYLQGIVYFKTNRIDSAWYHATRAFDKRPRAVPFCQFLLTLCAVRKDKITADQVFNKAISLNNNSRLWNHYIEVLSNLKVDNGKLMSLTDSALKKFPDDESLKKTKNDLERISQHQ